MSTLLKCLTRLEPAVTCGAIFRRERILPPYSEITVRKYFFQKDKKDNYGDKFKEPVSNYQHFRNGIRELRGEIKLWKQEVKEHFTRDPLVHWHIGVTDVVWDFKDPKTLEKFIVTSDKDNNEGFSTASLEMNRAGRALFSGHMNTKIPIDGNIKRTGYCNMRSMRYRKSFGRASAYDWTVYNTLVLKIRGDGRPYMLNLSTEGYYDISWSDIYQYILYTRGGPYWQTVKIPFSKFFLSSKGRIQDKQARIGTDRITHFGITCAGKVVGSFSLEIDHVGVEFDPEHEEDFAYELYATEWGISGV